VKDEKTLYDRLVTQMAAGDTQALEALYGALHSAVYGLALAILKDRGDAEDVMQNTFLKVWEHAPQYQAGTDAKAWILRIARNLAYHHFRDQKQYGILEEEENRLPCRDELTPSLDRILLDSLLGTLDSCERQIVMLYSVAGYSHKEIAVIVDRPYATVRWKFRNAVKKLAKLAEREGLL
jgi:RNA polymerase sigma-70 factor (ECF subfamily)